MSTGRIYGLQRNTCLRLSTWSLGNPDCLLGVEGWVGIIQFNPILRATVCLRRKGNLTAVNLGLGQ